MKELIDKITNKELTEAEKSLREELASIVEKKLYHKKQKMVAGDTPFKTDVERTGSVKAKRKSLRGVTKVLKNMQEAVVQKDGLVHLATGENVLPSVYRLRRWLTESNESTQQFYERHNDLSNKLKDDPTNPARKAIKMHLDKAEKYAEDDPEKAADHLKQAEKLHDMSHGKHIKEDSKADDKHFAKQDKKKQDLLNRLLRQGKSYSEAKKKLKEDCGLDPDKEKKVEAAREAAKLLLQPQLDTTAPRVDRTVVCIPKGVRPADRLTAPDLGPKEDEWMHGKKLEEEHLNEMARKVSDAATKAFLEKKSFKSKNTKSTGDELHLHGNKIAYHKDGKIHATLAGYPTMTTKERLNSLSNAVGGKRFHTKGGKHYYGDKEISSDEHVELT